VVAGNPDLIPQQAWVYEAALEQRFWGSGALVLTYRHFDINDVVDRVPILSPAGVILADAPGNIGTGTKDEYQLSLTVPMARLGVKDAQLKGQVTKRDTKVRDPLLGGTREISVLHPIDWEIHWSQDLPQWKATWGADLYNALRERYYRLTEIETRKISASLWLYAEYKPKPDWVIRFEAQAVNWRDAKRIREVYIGPRVNGKLDYTDVRSLEWRGSYIVRVRKIFG
jgi:outer membrane receptor protein involved in Fe transport